LDRYIGYRSNPSPIEMAADKFNLYLKEEGLDAVSAMRAARKQTDAPAHEIFARCAKSLVFSGSPSEPPTSTSATSSAERPVDRPTRHTPSRGLRSISLLSDANSA
jgi:hypothetical protein